MLDSILSRHEREGVSQLQLQDLFAPLSRTETIYTSAPATTTTTAHSCVFPSARLLATEVAPWVRSILRYDVAVEKERRQKASNLLSMGGKRKTRAARLALEGRDRGRKQRWLRGLGADVLKRSAGDGWPDEKDKGGGGGDLSSREGTGDDTRDGELSSSPNDGMECDFEVG